MPLIGSNIMKGADLTAWRALAYFDYMIGLSSLLSNNRDGILMYHGVGEPEAYGNVSVERFRADLAYLTEQYKVVDLDTLITTNSTTKRLAITFDDGYANFYWNARPILAEYDIPATVYVSTGFIGSEKMRNQQCSIMSETQLLDLVDNPLFAIGNHTVTHPRLATIETPGELRHEILTARDGLQELLGVSIDRFSYPHGNYDDRVRSIVAESHETAVTTMPQLLSDPVDPYEMPRIAAHNPPSHVRWELTDLGDRLRAIVT